MRFIMLIAVFLLPSLLMAQVQLNPPDNWTELETPSELPPEIIYLKKLASEDQSIQVTVTAMKPVDTTSSAEEVIAGLISGMKKGGFILESVSDLDIGEFPAKHIVGEFRSDQYEGAYLAGTKVVFSNEATISISVLVDDARGGLELGDSVVDWVSISGSPAVLTEGPRSASTNYSIGERVGYYGFWVVIGLAVIGVIRRSIQRRKKDKA